MPRRKTADDRLWKWDVKFTSEHVGRLIDETKPVMKQHAREMYGQLCRYEIATKVVLNTMPIAVNDIPPYLCFSREVWKASQKHSGLLLRREVGVLVGKWVARNLDAAVLWQIAYEVYTLSPLP